MEPDFDFYTTLRELLVQIPENRVTTYKILGEALGDPKAARAIAAALSREEFREFVPKVVRSGSEDAPFSDFESDAPLKKLCEHQKRMSNKVIKEEPGRIRRIAGVDAAYSNEKAYAVCVVVDEDLSVAETGSSTLKTRFPYIPGYLAFREAPALISAVIKCSGFDVLLVNGHGLAHPRGCGLATFVGIERDTPTIGVARRKLVGSIGEIRGDWSPVIKEGLIVGAELRRNNRSPVYVSVGHRVTLENSIDIIRDLQIEGSLPEPLRLAHMEAEREKRRDHS